MGTIFLLTKIMLPGLIYIILVFLPTTSTDTSVSRINDDFEI